jgi:hypothetical protein
MELDELKKKWYSPKYKLPPHNVQVLNEYDCVVTYNHKTKKWKKANGRRTEPKVWRER